MVSKGKDLEQGIVCGDKENHCRVINITSAKDKRLSSKAKGIMFYLLSKPKNWKGQVYDIVNNCTDGIRAIKAGLRELEAFGYVKLRSFPRKDSGQYQGMYYEFHSSPPRKKKVYVTPTIEKRTDKNIPDKAYLEPWMDGVNKSVYANN